MFKKINGVSQSSVRMGDSFFKSLMNTAADNILPYQWEALNDNVPGASPSYCIRNFKAAAGLIKEPHGGFRFQDSDLAKWLEAAAYMLMWRKDPETERRMDEVIDLIASAQLEDGYLDTYYILNDISKRWTNLRDDHELYCAGHMLEAAVAYYRATGKRKLLDVMIKYIDHIDSVFGPEENKKHGYPGHEEIELALIKLYEVTGDAKHLKLAEYFINERGKDGGKYFTDEHDTVAWGGTVYSGNRYYQAGEPVREQKHALGHAVRQCYLLSGMADTARETRDESLAQACRVMWKDITRRQMYITGAVGQNAFGEAFSFDYDLPNDIVYGETCASIAMAFFAQRMQRLELKGEYGDVLDTMLYNGTISGMNLEGNRFFYVNPLESWPERSEKSQPIKHVVSERRKWFGCACCPPNLARLICSLPGYVFLTEGKNVYVDLFTTCEADIALDNGSAKIATRTGYPYDGRVEIDILEAPEGFGLSVRKPGWCRNYTVTVNGKAVQCAVNDGFIAVNGLKAGDSVVYDMDMPARIVKANPRVRADAGKLAVCRGPIVYCLEEADNGANLSAVYVRANAELSVDYRPELLGGVAVISAPATRLTEKGWEDEELYASGREEVREAFTARFVPYYAWNNRGVGEMCVWVNAER